MKAWLLPKKEKKYCLQHKWAFLVTQMVKNLPVMETWVWSLGQEDLLERGRTTHSSTVAWRIPWTEEPGGLQSLGSQRVGHDWANKHMYSIKHNFTFYFYFKIYRNVLKWQCQIVNSSLKRWLFFLRFHLSFLRGLAVKILILSWNVYDNWWKLFFKWASLVALSW